MINKNSNKKIYHFNIFRKFKLFSFCIFDISEFYQDYPQFLEKHAIDFYALIFINNGNGNLFINKNNYLVGKDSLILIPPYKEYLFQPQGIKGFIVLFCQDFYTEEYPLTSLLKTYATSGDIAREIYALVLKAGKYSSEFPEVFSLIFKEYYINSSSSSPSVIRSYINILFLKIIDLKYKNPEYFDQNNNEIIIRFSKLLETKLHFQHDVGFYADTLAISKVRLNAVIKSNLNISPKKLILNKLMSEARKYLMNTDLSSSEIAYKLNFCDDSYFTKVFKKYHKITPGHFKTVHKKYHK